jgi:hypothetical protein
MQDFFSIDIRWKDVAAILNMSIMVSFIDIFEALYWHQMLTKSDEKMLASLRAHRPFSNHCCAWQPIKRNLSQ